MVVLLVLIDLLHLELEQLVLLEQQLLLLIVLVHLFLANHRRPRSKAPEPYASSHTNAPNASDWVCHRERNTVVS